MYYHLYFDSSHMQNVLSLKIIKIADSTCSLIFVDVDFVYKKEKFADFTDFLKSGENADINKRFHWSFDFSLNYDIHTNICKIFFLENKLLYTCHISFVFKNIKKHLLTFFIFYRSILIPNLTYRVIHIDLE